MFAGPSALDGELTLCQHVAYIRRRPTMTADGHGGPIAGNLLLTLHRAARKGSRCFHVGQLSRAVPVLCLPSTGEEDATWEWPLATMDHDG